ILMAIRYPNFGEIEPTHYADLLPELMEGYKRGREPHKIRQEEQARELANRINETHAQYLPEQYQTNIEGTRASTEGTKASTAAQLISNRFLPQKEQANIDQILASTGLTKGQLKELMQMLPGKVQGQGLENQGKSLLNKNQATANEMQQIDLLNHPEKVRQALDLGQEKINAAKESNKVQPAFNKQNLLLGAAKNEKVLKDLLEY